MPAEGFFCRNMPSLWPLNLMEQCGIFCAAGGVKTYISLTEICDIIFKFSLQ